MYDDTPVHAGGGEKKTDETKDRGGSRKPQLGPEATFDEFLERLDAADWHGRRDAANQIAERLRQRYRVRARTNIERQRGLWLERRRHIHRGAV